MEQRPRRTGQSKKRLPEVVQYALGHRTRVLILFHLNDSIHSVAELAEMIGEPINNVSNHVRELLDAGSIEIARTETSRNVIRRYYRAVEIPYFSREECEELTPEHFEMCAGLVVQTGSAEVVAALWGGKLKDPRVVLFCKWYDVDSEGRKEIEEEEERFLARLDEIEATASARRAASGEEAQPMVVTLFGFERALKNMPHGTRDERENGSDLGTRSPNGE